MPRTPTTVHARLCVCPHCFSLALVYAHTALASPFCCRCVCAHCLSSARLLPLRPPQPARCEFTFSLVTSSCACTRTSPCGCTPLCVACSTDNHAAAAVLIGLGADLDLEATEYAKPFGPHNPHTPHNPRTAEEGAHKKRRTPLMAAAAHGHVSILKLLIESRANVDQTQQDAGASVAYIAAQEGKLECIRCLAEAGANIHLACADDGATPTFAAAQEGHADVVRLLADFNANLDLATKDGTTPAWMASQENKLDVIEVLASCSADLNKTRESTWTAASQTLTSRPFLRDLGCAPYVLYGVKYIDLVSPATSTTARTPQILTQRPFFSKWRKIWIRDVF